MSKLLPMLRKKFSDVKITPADGRIETLINSFSGSSFIIFYETREWPLIFLAAVCGVPFIFVSSNTETRKCLQWYDLKSLHVADDYVDIKRSLIDILDHAPHIHSRLLKLARQSQEHLAWRHHFLDISPPDNSEYRDLTPFWITHPTLSRYSRPGGLYLETRLSEVFRRRGKVIFLPWVGLIPASETDVLGILEHPAFRASLGFCCHILVGSDDHMMVARSVSDAENLNLSLVMYPHPFPPQTEEAAVQCLEFLSQLEIVSRWNRI